MSNTSIIAFVLGAAIGSVVAWTLAKQKYEQIAQDEIEAMEEYYSNREPETEVPSKLPNEKPSISEYVSTIKDLGYAEHDTENKKEEEDVARPYIIAPEQLGEIDGYDIESLNYYADNVLTDDWDNIIENVDGMVGEDSLTHFGEYEDDSVFVRNDELKTDFEILRDLRKYSDLAPAPTDPFSDDE